MSLDRQPMSPARRLPGGPRLGPQRAPHEYYPTPPAATRAFLDAERFDGSIWECACGEGWMAKEIARAGYDVFASDIADYGYGKAGLDFLESAIPRGKHIITNPPYGDGLADRFVRKALALTAITGGKVAMLLNLSSLAHPARHASWVKRPPARIFVLDDCTCFPQGNPGEANRWTRTHRYCWAVWTSTPVTTTELRWLSTAPYHLRRRTGP